MCTKEEGKNRDVLVTVLANVRLFFYRYSLLMKFFNDSWNSRKLPRTLLPGRSFPVSSLCLGLEGPPFFRPRLH